MILDAVLPFVIMLTNPIGSPTSLGYPSVVYQPYLRAGEKTAPEYATLASCEQQLQQVQQDGLRDLEARPVMPEYRNVVTQRLGSLQCLHADAKPAARKRGAVVVQDFRWHIGRQDGNGFFQGQSYELRQFLDQRSCEEAYSAMLRLRSAESAQLRQTYRCMPVAIKPPPLARLY